MPRANGRVVPVTGVFTGGPDAAYIGLSLESGEEAYPGIYHEYSHYLLRGAFSAVPLWFNEGLAEYYSMFEVTNGGRSARIGSPHESHIALLRDRRLPLPQTLRDHWRILPNTRATFPTASSSMRNRGWSFTTPCTVSRGGGIS